MFHETLNSDNRIMYWSETHNKSLAMMYVACISMLAGALETIKPFYLKDFPDFKPQNLIETMLLIISKIAHPLNLAKQ